MGARQLSSAKGKGRSNQRRHSRGDSASRGRGTAIATERRQAARPEPAAAQQAEMLTQQTEVVVSPDEVELLMDANTPAYGAWPNAQDLKLERLSSQVV